MAPFRRRKTKPLPSLPIKIRAKDMEIDRLVRQAGELTEVLQETVARLAETLRRNGGGGDDSTAAG